MNLNSPTQGLAPLQLSAGFPLLQSRLQAQPFPKTPPEGLKQLLPTPEQRGLAAASGAPREPPQEGGGGGCRARTPAIPPHLCTLCALRSRAPRSAQRWDTQDLARRVEGRGGEKGRGAVEKWGGAGLGRGWQKKGGRG